MLSWWHKLRSVASFHRWRPARVDGDDAWECQFCHRRTFEEPAQFRPTAGDADSGGFL
jgi:hypothetical protein